MGVEREVTDPGLAQLWQRARRFRQPVLALPGAGELQHGAVRLQMPDGHRRICCRDECPVHVDCCVQYRVHICRAMRSSALRFNVTVM